MWKSVDEITAHNQANGRPAQHDPFESINTFVVEVEALTLEGPEVLLISCCESVRMKRDDVIAWREVAGSDGNPSLYSVRLRKGAQCIAQRAVIADPDAPPCRRCGRGYDGLPPARGPSDHGHGHQPGGGGHEAHGHGCENGRDDCGPPSHGHGGHAEHGHGGHAAHGHGGHAEHGHGGHAAHGHGGHADHGRGHGGREFAHHGDHGGGDRGGHMRHEPHGEHDGGDYVGRPRPDERHD